MSLVTVEKDGNFDLLRRFYDPHSGVICIPGLIYEGSKIICKEVKKLLLVDQYKGVDDKYINWVIEFGYMENYDEGGTDWRKNYNFEEEFADLFDDVNKISSLLSDGLYKDVYVFIREVESF